MVRRQELPGLCSSGQIELSHRPAGEMEDVTLLRGQVPLQSVEQALGAVRRVDGRGRRRAGGRRRDSQGGGPGADVAGLEAVLEGKGGSVRQSQESPAVIAEGGAGVEARPLQRCQVTRGIVRKDCRVRASGNVRQVACGAELIGAGAAGAELELVSVGLCPPPVEAAYE